MNRSVRMFVLVAVIVFCVVILCLSTSVGQDRKSYEVPAQIYGVTAARSDADHAVDAYERLMQRYTDLTERNLAAITIDLDALARRLDAIDAKLTALDARLARIEQFHVPASIPAANPAPPTLPQPPVPVAGTPVTPAAPAAPAAAPVPSPRPAQ
jgi:hypothetical protein